MLNIEANLTGSRMSILHTTQTQDKTDPHSCKLENTISIDIDDRYFSLEDDSANQIGSDLKDKDKYLNSAGVARVIAGIAKMIENENLKTLVSINEFINMIEFA